MRFLLDCPYMETETTIYLQEVPLEETFHDPAWLQEGNCKKPCPQITNWMTIDTSYVSDR